MLIPSAGKRKRQTYTVTLMTVISFSDHLSSADMPPTTFLCLRRQALVIVLRTMASQCRLSTTGRLSQQWASDRPFIFSDESRRSHQLDPCSAIRSLRINPDNRRCDSRLHGHIHLNTCIQNTALV